MLNFDRNNILNDVELADDNSHYLMKQIDDLDLNIVHYYDIYIYLIDQYLHFDK